MIKESTLYATTAIVGIIIILQIAALLRYIEKSNRDLTRFLESIRYSDFSQSFSGRPKGSSFDELNIAFENVIIEFKKARVEKEEQYRYLQTLVQHVGLGIISFDQNGQIDLINYAAKKLLNVTYLNNINSLETFSRSLVEGLKSIRTGEKKLIRVDDHNEPLTLAIYATEFKIPNRIITIISMQNIESELAEQEMEAWQKLIRVMTHEIMNSVTPIASLASTINNLIVHSDRDLPEIDSDRKIEIRNDIQDAAAVIEKRSRGLLHFVDAYRNLTRIPKPEFKIFPVRELLDRIAQLMKEQIEKKKIKLTITVKPESLELTADPELVEQVLINLLINAIRAVEMVSNSEIEFDSKLDDRGRVLISIKDNGHGISDKIRDKIFTPFFTTRSDGSGIGLSLSRQIMRLHNGSIGVSSSPGAGATFTMRF
jgi:nitrogen fixation/metabolism regulation signal transduction histidine kinase